MLAKPVALLLDDLVRVDHEQRQSWYLPLRYLRLDVLVDRIRILGRR
jgi:hypothetical protein